MSLRFIAAVAALLSLTATAQAGVVTITVPGSTYEITGTAYAETVAAAGSFQIFGTLTSTTPNGVLATDRAPAGYSHWSGAVDVPGATVTFSNCILTSSQAQETGLAFYEWRCLVQTGSF